MSMRFLHAFQPVDRSPAEVFCVFFSSPNWRVSFVEVGFVSFLKGSQGILKPATPEIETGSDRHRDLRPRTCKHEFWLGNDQSFLNLENDLYIVICYNIRCDVLVQCKVLHPPRKKISKNISGEVNLVPRPTTPAVTAGRQEEACVWHLNTGIKQVVGSRCFLRPWWNSIYLAILKVTIFGMVKTWPVQRLSDTQLGDRKVTTWIAWHGCLHDICLFGFWLLCLFFFLNFVWFGLLAFSKGSKPNMMTSSVFLQRWLGARRLTS